MGILDRVVRNERIMTIPPIKWMIEGPPKTGKSTMAASWPDPIFMDMPGERGLQFLAGVSRLPVENWSDLRDAYNELRKGGHPYKTVVIDTIDACFELAAADHTKGGKMKIQDYPVVYSMVLRTIEAFCGLGMHVVATAHTKALMRKVSKGEDPIVDRYVNALPGQLSSRVGGMMDHILHTKVNDEGEFRVLCRQSSLYEAGGRIKELPLAIKVPEGSKFFDVLRQSYEQAVAGDTAQPPAPPPAETTKAAASKARKPPTKPADGPVVAASGTESVSELCARVGVKAGTLTYLAVREGHLADSDTASLRDLKPEGEAWARALLEDPDAKAKIEALAEDYHAQDQANA